MRDHLSGRRRAPLGLVRGRVRVADQGRVVAADQRPVQRRADARVGLRAGNDEPPDAEALELGREGRVLERVAVLLVDDRLVLAGSKLGDDLPPLAPRPLDQSSTLAQRRAREPVEDIVLQVHDEQRRRRCRVTNPPLGTDPGRPGAHLRAGTLRHAPTTPDGSARRAGRRSRAGDREREPASRAVSRRRGRRSAPRRQVSAVDGRDAVRQTADQCPARSSPVRD